MKLFSKRPTTGRQRLLNGQSQAPNPYMYRAKRYDELLNTGRQQQRKQLQTHLRLQRIFWLHRFGLIILGLAVLICLISVISLSSSAKVIPLSADSQFYLHTTPQYQSVASKLLANSLWNRNKITIDTNRISQQMLKQYPELAAVSITLPLLGHRPIVYLQPAQPALILSSSQGSFVVDTTGKALLQSSTADAFKRLGLPVVTDQSGLHVVLGQHAMTSDNVNFINTILAELTARHINVSAFVLPAATSELDVHIAGQSYFVKFNLHAADAREQAGTYLATISQLQTQNITPAQYIDVRVDGRAYYQ